MPQNTNLNINPYNDDFDPKKGYQKVLFKPGTPIQSRELTTLQTILQDQIEKFGKHFFKEGSVVLPGQTLYDPSYTCVQIDETHLGIPVSAYLDSFIGKTIKGETSGVTAKIETYISDLESENNNYTLYIKYTSSSDTDFVTQTFLDGENLITLEDISYSLGSIRENTSFATTIISNSTAVGSAAKIEEGVYFIRGFFVTVDRQSIILDQYSNTPSYRIGLLISEEFAIASSEYKDLYDNAQGFSNFSAPGADRLKLSCTFIKKELDDFNDENFVELLRVENGEVQRIVNRSNYNLIKEELARRTYDESGDYYTKPFSILAKESLNDKIGNNGLYSKNQITPQGNAVSDDILCLSVSPGKAYVRGYEIEIINNTIIDVEKPRTTEIAQNESISFNSGRKIIVDNVYGSVPIGFGLTSYVDLYSDRTSTPGLASNKKIGIARVYNFKLKSSEYIDASTKFEIFLYDVQTYTEITLNSSITLSTPAYIQGSNSGASGYLVTSVSSNTITLYQTSGSFIPGESIKINGQESGRTITSIKDYNLSDVHQILANENISGTGSFTCDPVLSSNYFLSNPGAQFTITAASGGISTVTTSSNSFYNGVNVGDIVSYTKQGQSIITYNKVKSVNITSKTLILEPTTSVVGVSSGGLPTSTITVNDFKKVFLEVSNTSDAYLYSELNHKNVSQLNLNNSDFILRKTYSISSGEFSDGAWSQTLETDPNLTLEPFDEEDYTLTFSNGSIATLSDQKLTVSGRTISIQGITPNSNSALLTVTYKKSNAKTRKKIYTRCSELLVDKISSGINTNSNGLTLSSIYGLRVDDEEISLNIPDVESVLGIFESSSSSDPVLPSLTLTNLNSNILNAVKGERIVGEKSNAVAVLISTNGTNSVRFVYLNENRFLYSENITFEESNITAVIGFIETGDKNILNNYILDTGHRSEYLDFSRIIRKKEFAPPSKKLKIIYNHYVINSSDSGDFASVSSYDKDRYKSDIPFVDGISCSDIIDVRPIVAPYSGTRSPFEYQSRIFTSTNSSPYIFANDKSFNLSYNYYVGRIDKLYLTREGIFILNKGVPSLNPKDPSSLDSALEIGTIYLPPYVYDSREVRIRLSSHKRYTMKDISRLENRLSNVEYYTSLSLLETDTQNLTIRDPQTNLDRFKCGFFVDNFKSINGGQVNSRDYKSSIDTSNGILRPQHYTTSLDLLLGSEAVIGVGTTSNPNADLRFVTDLSSPNIKRVGDVVCLNYSDVEYTKNPFATRSENVNPFNVINWISSIELNPSSDTWIEPRITRRVIESEGNFNSSAAAFGVDTNTGISPIQWNSWETTWTGETINSNTLLLRQLTGTTFTGVEGSSLLFRDDFVEFSNQNVTTNTNQTRQGVQFRVSERFDTQNLGPRVVSRDVINTMRSRNIEIIARRLKPNTRIYAFFDNVDMNQYIIPKLLEVSMVSGTFVAGETVVGTLNSRSIVFRLATQNHKYGPYNSPTETYSENPYNPSSSLSNLYSSSTTILNVDTASLELQASSGFYGSVINNMRLVGRTSSAVATITNIKLVTDSAGVFIGSLFIPDPTNASAPVFETGTKTFTLTSSPTNSRISLSDQSIGEANFTSNGTLENIDDITLRIRNANIERTTSLENRVLTETENRTVGNNTFTTRSVPIPRWSDPLAQSFQVSDRNGIYLTKCDVFFRTKDSRKFPVTLQIRTLELGLPTQVVLPFSEVTLEPEQVKISEDGSVPTTFTFLSPVFLEGSNNAYAIVLISPSDSYNVWISRMGEVDISTINSPDSEKIIVSQQPVLGSLYKSQNGATWDPSQLEDLKFTLYRANFVTSPGSFRFYNPDLDIGNRQITSLRPDALSCESKSVLVGLGKSLISSEQINLSVGALISQEQNSNFTGRVRVLAGSIGIGSNLTITNAGTGYTSGSYVYPNVNLTSITGFGQGAKGNLSISGGVAVAITMTNGGYGYSFGDTLTVNSTETNNFGKNLIISIPNTSGIISSFNSLLIDSVQGNINVNNTDAIIGNGVTLSGATVNSSIELTDGLHIRVNHNNHGMYSANNRVKLSGIESDTFPSTLLVDYSSTSTESINLLSVSNFNTFENVGISTLNPGYILIDDEIIQYTGITTNTLIGITRGIDSTPQYHFANSKVFKYEMNGISLRRINTVHTFTETNLVKYPIELDSYSIKINTSQNGIDRTAGNINNFPQLFFKDNKSSGSYEFSNPQVNSVNGAKASHNILFNSIRPNIQTLLPETTTVDASIRTFTSTSIGGNEIPYVDTGFESISLNENNIFYDTRAIYSKVNETNSLSQYPGSRSFTLELTLNTADSKVSPMIDLDRVNIITTMNRINSPILDFTEDPRVNSIGQDPNAAIYISKIVKLEKTADNLKVLFDAYRHISNDIILMYRIFRNDSPDSQQLYELFPGYDNLDVAGNIINPSKNSGKPDSFVRSSSFFNDYIPYEYTAKNLPPFNGFQIKIIMTGNNQAYVPNIRDLRVIASI